MSRSGTWARADIGAFRGTPSVASAERPTLQSPGWPNTRSNGNSCLAYSSDATVVTALNSRSHYPCLALVNRSLGRPQNPYGIHRTVPVMFLWCDITTDVIVSWPASNMKPSPCRHASGSLPWEFYPSTFLVASPPGPHSLLAQCLLSRYCQAESTMNRPLELYTAAGGCYL